VRPPFGVRQRLAQRRHTLKVEDPDRPDTYQSGLDMAFSADRKTLVTLSYYHAKKQGTVPPQDFFVTGWDTAARKQLHVGVGEKSPAALSSRGSTIQGTQGVRPAPSPDPNRLPGMKGANP
jgi:hypothetical protein